MAAAVNHVEQLYGGDDLYSPRAIQAYLQQVRRADRAAGNEIADSAEVLSQVIASSPGVGVLLGYDTRRKARWICEPLNEAANAHNAAASLAALAWKRFHHHFGDAIEHAQKAKSGRRKTMDWTDA